MAVLAESPLVLVKNPESTQSETKTKPSKKRPLRNGLETDVETKAHLENYKTNTDTKRRRKGRGQR